ncbi:hypothetical protein BDV06DRAFT_216164 [Aspergillus oleicola]
MTKDPNLLKTISDWRKQVKQSGMGSASLHTAEELDSASAIELEQYYRLQFCWKTARLSEWQKAAEDLLKPYRSWKQYCDSLNSPEIPGSTFALVHIMTSKARTTPPRHSSRIAENKSGEYESDDEDTFFQYQSPTTRRGAVKYTPYSPKSPGDPEVRAMNSTPTPDEQIINTPLLNLLTALIIPSTASYEARTDGYLECPSEANDEKKVRALVEVKEAAQTVAWLKSRPGTHGALNKPGRRIHVSQDRHEIYIIVAEYDERYLKYLGGKDDSSAFMTMKEYGPWDTGYVVSMKHLGPILVAIALRAESDLEEEKKRARQQTPH